MSNYDWDAPPGLEGQVLVGAEVMNGTGEVVMRFFEDAGDVILAAGHARELAALLSRKASEAEQAQRDANRPC